MPQMTGSLLSNASNLGAWASSRVSNIANGAQLGFGNNLRNFDAATPLVLPPLIPIVTHMPTIFNNIPRFNAALKSLIERHAREISGVELTYELEGQGVPAGQDGQEAQVPTNSKRSAVNPQFTFYELYGNMIWNMIRTWIWAIKHPDTQASSYLSGLITDSETISPLLFSSFSMDVLFIQPDATMKPGNIIDAFFVTCMWPQSTGSSEWKKSVGQSTVPERTITFNGVAQHNEQTVYVGSLILEALNLHQIDYNQATPIATSIEARLRNMGLEKEVTEKLSEFKSLI